MKHEIVAGFLGMSLISGIRLGLADSIGKTIIWIIAIGMLLGTRVGWYQDTVENPEAK